MQENDAFEKADEIAADNLFLSANLEGLHVLETEEAAIASHTIENVEIQTNESGIPTMTLMGMPVYEDKAPIEKVKQQVRLLEGDDQSNLVVLFGLGLGYHAEQLERRFSCPLIVYDPCLDAVATTLGRRILNLRNTVLCIDQAHLVSEAQHKLQFNDRKIIAAAVPVYQKLFPEEFAAFVGAMDQAVNNARIMENTISVRANEWVYHAVKNVPKAADKPGIDILCDKFKAKPGILVSAGPSLDKNIEELKAAQGRAIIISVNAAAAPLAKAGIKPDIIAAVEGLDLRMQLENLPWLKDVSLSLTLNCFPGFFDLPARNIFSTADHSVVCSNWFVRAFNRHYFSSGGSVSCSAFSMLYAFGCDPIILIGQDLAYTDNRSYSAATTFGKQSMQYDPLTKKLKAIETDRNHTIESIRTDGGLKILDNLDAVEVPAYGNQGTVISIGIFNLFRSWFEGVAAMWAKGRTFINATQGGAHIEGFKEIPLKEALATYCNEPVQASKIINDTVKATPKNDIAALADVIRQDMDVVDRLIDITEKTVAAAEKSLEEVKKDGVVSADSSLRRLSALESELRHLSRTSRIIDTFVSGKVNRLRRERHMDEDENIDIQTVNSLNRTVRLLKVIKKGCMESKDMFASVTTQLQKME